MVCSPLCTIPEWNRRDTALLSTVRSIMNSDINCNCKQLLGPSGTTTRFQIIVGSSVSALKAPLFSKGGCLVDMSFVLLISSHKTWWRLMALKYSATRSTAAFAPCRGASRMEQGAPGCRTPNYWPWVGSRCCPTPG